MIGLIVGAAAGGIQYWLLSLFTARVTRGALTTKSILLGLFQFILPAGVLVGMAFLRRSDLLWTAVGITGCLVVCAVVKFTVGKSRSRGREG